MSGIWTIVAAALSFAMSGVLGIWLVPYLRKKHFGMYSKIAAGISFLNTNMKDVDPTVATEKNKDVAFNFQASLLGIEAGGQLRGFAEFGMGEQGAILIGIRYNF